MSYKRTREPTHSTEGHWLQADQMRKGVTWASNVRFAAAKTPQQLHVGLVLGMKEDAAEPRSRCFPGLHLSRPRVLGPKNLSESSPACCSRPSAGSLLRCVVPRGSCSWGACRVRMVRVRSWRCCVLGEWGGAQGRAKRLKTSPPAASKCPPQTHPGQQAAPNVCGTGAKRQSERASSGRAVLRSVAGAETAPPRPTPPQSPKEPPRARWRLFRSGTAEQAASPGPGGLFVPGCGNQRGTTIRALGAWLPARAPGPGQLFSNLEKPV